MFSCEFCEISKNTFFLQNTCGGCFWSVENTLVLKFDKAILKKNNEIDNSDIIINVINSIISLK